MKYVFVGALGLALALTGCGHKGADASLHTVVTVTPTTVSSSGARQVTLPGVVKEAHNVKMTFKSAGQLDKVLVKEGDYVKQGQLIAVLDAGDYKIGLDAAQAQYDQVKNEVARVEQLYHRGSVSANEYEKAMAGLAQVEAQLRGRRNQVEYTRLYAPASGYIDQLYFRQSEMVDAGTPVASLLAADNMQVEVQLPSNMHRDRDVLGNFYACIDGNTYPLQLVSIAPKTDGTQMYRMQLSLPALAELALASGSNVDVTFTIGTESQSMRSPELAIPVSAVLNDATGSYVMVVSADSTVRKRPVTLGSIDGNGDAVVTAGLAANEAVVKAGAQYLRDGEKVEILDRDSKTNIGNLL